MDLFFDDRLGRIYALASTYLALGQAPVVVVAPVTGTNPLFSIILAWVFLRQMERLTLRVVLGAVLVVAGVTVVSVSQAG